MPETAAQELHNIQEHPLKLGQMVHLRCLQRSSFVQWRHQSLSAAFNAVWREFKTRPKARSSHGRLSAEKTYSAASNSDKYAAR